MVRVGEMFRAPTAHVEMNPGRLLLCWNEVRDWGGKHRRLVIHPELFGAGRELDRLKRLHANDPAALGVWFGFWVVMEHPFGDCNHRTGWRALHSILRQAGIRTERISWPAAVPLWEPLDQHEPVELEKRKAGRYLEWLRKAILDAMSDD